MHFAYTFTALGCWQSHLYVWWTSAWQRGVKSCNVTHWNTSAEMLNARSAEKDQQPNTNLAQACLQSVWLHYLLLL